MKILALSKTNRRGDFEEGIVQLTGKELAQLAGREYGSSNIPILRDKEGLVVTASEVKIDDVINVSSLYEKAAQIRDAWEDLWKTLGTTKAGITRLQNTMKEQT